VTLPNFLVIGAMKSGTTSLYHYLRQHPEVFVPPARKEAQFFCYEGRPPRFRGPGDDEVNRYAITDLAAYAALFEEGAGRPAIGEVGTVYVYVPGSAERIREHVPDARLIAILRNPADRVYSNFVHLVREGLEPCSDLAEALRREPSRIHGGWSPHWHYLQAGFYHAQLRRFLDVFDRRQLRVYLYDDYRADAVGLLQDMFRFLGVDPSFRPDVSLRHNVAGLPRSRALHRFLDRRHRLTAPLRLILSGERRLALREWIRGLNLRRAPAMDPALRRRLIDVYRSDILALQDLLERDLSGWLAPSAGDAGGE
jgi:hypothetical protein